MKTLLGFSPGMLLAAGLAACSSAPTRIHTLEPVASSQPRVAYAGAPVRVAAVTLPPELDRIEVVTEQASGGWRIHDGDHWAAPAGKLAQQVLSADLLSRLPDGKVTFPRLPAGRAAAELRVDILRVSAGADERWAASWQVQTDSQPGPAGLINLKLVPHAESADAATRALSDLLGELADALAVDLARAAAGQAP